MRLGIVLITGKQAEVLISVSSLIRLGIVINLTIIIQSFMIPSRPAKTVLKAFEEPSVVVRACWASIAWILLMVTCQFIRPNTTLVYLIRLEVILAVELEE